MNNELFEFYANCLIEVRAPERAAPLVELVELLMDFGYDESLSEIHNVAKDNLQNDILAIEKIIINCTVHFGSKLGVSLDPARVNAVPSVVARLLYTLTGDLEDFEDFETLHVIANSGETEEFILENIMRHIYADESIFLDGLFLNVEPRVVTVIQTYLEARIIENDATDVDYDAQARLVRYIRRYPTNPMVNLFANAAYKQKAKTIADSLQWDEDYKQFELAIIYLVGLVCVDSVTYEEAYPRLEERVNWLPVEPEETDLVLAEAVDGLKAVYEQE
tara:strand:- start:591 stop:1421 length:831 start_codon:yes stop_codon:yes gene_type:complete